MIYHYAALNNTKGSSSNTVGRLEICLYACITNLLATMATDSLIFSTTYVPIVVGRNQGSR